MEVFTGDQQIRFPDTLTPFPENAGAFYDDQTVRIHSQVDHLSIPPPQKLRPIRCNGYNLTEYLDPNGGIDGTLTSCDGIVSLELGFLTQLSAQKPSVLNGAPERYAAAPADLRSCNLPKIGVGNACSLVGAPAVLVGKMKSEIDAECMNLISQARILEAELSSSSSDDYSLESSEAISEPLYRKRKRKTRKKLELFLENMMRKIVEKQEQMHNQLLEMVEKKEKDRIIREEAWKQQQIEKGKREEELRAQETSRSLALISFIQNFLGHEIQIPKSLETSCLEKDDGEIHNQEDFKCDPSNRRWPKSEVQALITVRTALDQRFFKGTKGSLWEEVAAGLSNLGYSRTAKKCKEKWENINKYYKKTMENGKNLPDNGKACPYFHDLDIVYKSGLITQANSSNYMKKEIEGNSVKE